jgi:hypothetical protein
VIQKSDPEVAVLVAVVDRDDPENWVVVCPVCGRRNTHGAELGYRCSHCHCTDGYIMAPPGAQEAPYESVCRACRDYFVYVDEDPKHLRPRRLAFYRPLDLTASDDGVAVMGQYRCDWAHEWQCRWTDKPTPEPLPPVGPGTRCALYRHYDDDGVLLYVGISDRPVQRGKSHARHASWVQFAARIDAIWLANRTAAEEAEVTAIRVEQPVFNVANALGDVEARISAYLDAARRGVRV